VIYIDTFINTGEQQRLTLDEMETHALSAKNENYCTVDTSIPSDWNRLNKLGWEVVSIDKYKDGKIRSVIFKAPKKCISFRKCSDNFCDELSTGRVISEKNRQAFIDRMHKKDK